MNTKCIHNNCTKKNIIENEYCKSHQIIYCNKLLEIDNKKSCMNYNKGCRNAIYNYGHIKKCQDCLKFDINKKNNTIRRKRPVSIKDTDKIIEFCEKNNIININNSEIVFCNKCLNGFPKIFFMDRQEEKINCKECRNKMYRNEQYYERNK